LKKSNDALKNHEDNFKELEDVLKSQKKLKVSKEF
jgi:hypothetical protein